MLKQSISKITYLLTAFIGTISTPIFSADAALLAQDENKAVILAYHRIGEDAYPESNIRTDQFLNHISILKNEGYNVLPVDKIIEAYHQNTDLPEKSIAITFSGSYNSPLNSAIPHLLENKIPFTVFYDAQKISESPSEYIYSKDLIKLSDNPLVTIGVTLTLPEGTNQTDDTALRQLINKSRQNYRDTFNAEADLFSYPYTGYNTLLKKLVKEQGYKAALTLNSGVTYKNSDHFALPRFSMTEKHADPFRFRLITSALPLPVSDIEPKDPVITSSPFHIGFTLDEKLNAEDLNCFLSEVGKIDFASIGQRIEIRSDQTMSNDTLHINCTILESAQDHETPQWRWFGRTLFSQIIPQPDELPLLRE
ncbi:MAG: polysaccharide deacetylase family protein [Micavibrio sp.]|nr:polysaccharide deacetylase family protein [Micavibrio sp.]